MKLVTLEDYIDFMSGLKDLNGNHTTIFRMRGNSPLKLASYDVAFIESLSDQISAGIPMTSKQVMLAERLLSVYQRQLGKLGVALPEKIVLRNGIRAISYDKKVSIDDGKIQIKFPYNSDLIEILKTYAKTAQGSFAWNHEARVWELGMTEYNVSLAVALGEAHKMEITDEVRELFKQIEEVEKTPYRIELTIEDGKPVIKNAPKSMLEYIEEHVGFDDLLKLVDASGALGYTVDENIMNLVSQEKGTNFKIFCEQREINAASANSGLSISLDDIIVWAKEVGRLPICVYSPNFIRNNLSPFHQFFTQEEIIQVGIADADAHFSSYKLVFTNRILDTWEGRIPLLITYANLFHGSIKKRFLEKAEKIAYFCPELPNR